MRRMNWRFLGIIVVAGVALGAAVFGLHEFQVSRHARFFLDQAHRAKEEKKAGEAIGYLNRYLQLAPDDTDALAELGLLLAERRMDRAAYATLEKVLRSNPNRTEARRKLVEVGIRLRRYRDAKEHLQGYLLKEAPKDGQLREWLGACQAAQGDSAAAAKSLQLAVQYAPSRIETYRHLAELLRYRLDRPEEADQWMEKLIAANPKDSRAHRDYGEYLAGIGQHDRAAQQAAEALEIAPHDADSLLLAARCALARGKYQEGRQYAQRGLKLHPKLTALYASLAAIELRSGQRNEAIAALRQGAASAAEPAPLKWQLASLLLDAGKVEEARPIAGELRAGGYSESLVVYLEARIDYAQGHWLAASREFQGIHADMADRPDLAASADYWLGNCYGELGDTERQLASYRSAVAENLSWLPPRLAAVAVLESMGRLDEAMDEQRQILKIDGTFAGGWLNLARLELLSNLRLEPARRNWHGVEEALAPVAAANPKSAEVALFRAEVLFAEGRIAEAEKLLSDAQGDNPKDVRVRVARADLAERQQQWDRAAAVVDEARQQLGESVPLRLARARCLVRRDPKAAAQSLRPLASPAEGFSGADQRQLWGGLLPLVMEAGDREQAARLARLLAEKEPNQLPVRLVLLELALRGANAAGMEQTLKEIESLEGQGPYWHFGQALRLRLAAEQGGPELLDEARSHLEEARRLRPAWFRPAAVLGQIFDQQGQDDRALTSYAQAVELGDREPNTVRRVVELLFQRQRYAEADQLIRRLEQEPAPPFSAELARMASGLSLELQDFERGLALARQAAAQSQDYRDHVWLGEVLAVLARRATAQQRPDEARQWLGEAEQALRHAVELAREVPQPWVALILFLVRNDRPQEAEKTLADPQARQTLDQAPLALALCYEALGKPDEAARQCEALLARSPDDPLAVARAADFYLRAGRPQQAQSQLERIIDGRVKAQASDVHWARRRMALLLAARGGYQNLQRALALVEENLKTAHASPQDEHVKAIVLSSHPQRSRRQEAARLLDRLLAQGQAVTAEDRLLLARLYLGEGDWPGAGRQLRTLVAAHGKEPRYVEAYIRALLARGEIQDAELWLKWLEKLAPGQFSTTALRAQALAQRGRPEEAAGALLAFADLAGAEPPDRAARLALVAASLEELALRTAAAQAKDSAARIAGQAEAAYRQLVAQRPRQTLLLAAFLARQNRLDEALDLAEKHWPEADPADLADACEVLLRGSAAGPSAARVEKILLAALDQHGRPVPLLLTLAEVRLLQERYAQADELYREVLRKNPQSVTALNNLAVFLALRHVQLDEALRLINRAISVAGPDATLLDSRATVHLALAKPQAALADLHAAIAEAPSASVYFHQAQALRQAGQSRAAAVALGEAEKLGLTAEQLPALERPIYRALRAGRGP